MRFRLYQLKRKLIKFVDGKMLSFLKYIFIKKPNYSWLLHAITNAFPSLFSFVTYKISFISNHNGYQVYDSNFQSFNYGYVDIETREREKIPVTIDSVGYSLFSDAQIIAGSEFIFTGSIAIRQEYLNTPNFLNSKYAVFHGGILNNADYLLAYKPILSKQVIPKGVFISGPHEQNWYHWLIEILPKLHLFTKIISEFQDYKIIVTEDVFNLLTHKQSIRCFVDFEDVITIEGTKSYKVEQLIVIEAPFTIPSNGINLIPFSLSDCFTHYGIMNSFKNYLESQIDHKKSTEGFDRVFLFRNQKNRKYNQDQVLCLLESYDFKAVDMSTLDFFGQMQVINNAKLIVGPAGAAWANILFCANDSDCIIFRPHNTGDNPFLNNLSMLSNTNVYDIKYFNPHSNWRDLRGSETMVRIDLKALEELVVRLIN